MAEKKQNIDNLGRTVITEQEICNQLYVDPRFDYKNVSLPEIEKYNNAIDALYLSFPKLTKYQQLDIDPETWHANRQQEWFMPDSYKELDITQWVLDQCSCETELQRAAEELLLFAKVEQMDLLRYLKYLVDQMKQNNIVWGVGRGSSVASFVLYLIGVHKVNSIKYDLSIDEFIR